MTEDNVKIRFLTKVNQLGLLHSRLNTRCWLWIAGIKSQDSPYGQFWVNGRNEFAHRVSYDLFIGFIPEDLSVLHHCDNPVCVNPEHLFIGTHQDNMLDRDSKNRQAKGKTHYSFSRPDLVPRGDKAGARLHPEESWAEGITL